MHESIVITSDGAVLVLTPTLNGDTVELEAIYKSFSEKSEVFKTIGVALVELIHNRLRVTISPETGSAVHMEDVYRKLGIGMLER